MIRRSPLDNVDQAIREAKVFENLYEEARMRTHRKWVDNFARSVGAHKHAIDNKVGYRQLVPEREQIYAAAPPADHPHHETKFEERSYAMPHLPREELRQSAPDYRTYSYTENHCHKESYRLMRSHRAKELRTLPGNMWMSTQSAGAFKKATAKGFETLALPPIQPLHAYPEAAGYPCGNGWVPIEKNDQHGWGPIRLGALDYPS